MIIRRNDTSPPLAPLKVFRPTNKVIMAERLAPWTPANGLALGRSSAGKSGKIGGKSAEKVGKEQAKYIQVYLLYVYKKVRGHREHLFKFCTAGSQGRDCECRTNSLLPPRWLFQSPTLGAGNFPTAS